MKFWLIVCFALIGSFAFCQKHQLAKPTLLTLEKDCVFTITAGPNLGTGFVSGGYLFTCAHVIKGADGIYYDNGHGIHGAVVSAITVNPTVDLAVFYIGQTSGQPLADYASEQPGSPVTVIGSPEGLRETIASGTFSAKRQRNGLDVAQISAPISPGSSGSPVFNSKGQIIGMVTSFLTEGQNLNFALAASEIKKHWMDGTMLQSQTPVAWTAEKAQIWAKKAKEEIVAFKSVIANIDPYSWSETARSNFNGIKDTAMTTAMASADTVIGPTSSVGDWLNLDTNLILLMVTVDWLTYMPDVPNSSVIITRDQQQILINLQKDILKTVQAGPSQPIIDFLKQFMPSQ